MKQRFLPVLFVVVQATLLACVAPSARGVALAIGALAVGSWHPRMTFRLGLASTLALMTLAAVPALLLGVPQVGESQGDAGGPLVKGVWALQAALGLVAAQAALLYRQVGAVPCRVRLLLGMSSVTVLAHFENSLQSMSILSNGVLFGVAAAAYADSMRARRPRASSRLDASGAPQRQRQRQRLIALVLLVAAAAGVSGAERLASQVASFRRMLASQLATREMRHGSVGFTTNATLYSMSQQKQTNAMFPALRVFSQEAPGYLRGRVYDRFNGAQWGSGPARRRQGNVPATPARPRAQTGNRLFEFRQGRAPWTASRVRLEFGLTGFYFLPIDAVFLEVAGPAIALDAHDVVIRGPNAIEYWWHDGDHDRPPPPDDYLAALRAPIEGLDPQVDRLSERLARGVRTTAERIDRVRRYFRDNYSYSLVGVRPPEGVDALSYFLLQRPAGHCEFFASGTVALLRAQGVACRYATGFLVMELEDEKQEYWVARNRDAHAWVEAYDPERQRWVIVESTPGVEGAVDRQLAEKVDGTVALVDSASGGLAFWRSWMLAIRQMAGSPAYVLTLIALVLLLRHLILNRRAPQDALTAMRVWLERRLRRRGWVREPAETLHQFSARIEAAGPLDDWLGEAVAWLREYAAVRFGMLSGEGLADPRSWRVSAMSREKSLE